MRSILILLLLAQVDNNLGQRLYVRNVDFRITKNDLAEVHKYRNKLGIGLLKDLDGKQITASDAKEIRRQWF